MDLIIFDIDGTVTDSVEADYQCFEQALQEVFKEDFTDIVWDGFPHMTDSALIKDVVITKLGRAPRSEEITNFQTSFFTRLQQSLTEMKPIPGAVPLINKLGKEPNCQVGFATGCWKRSATIKLAGAGIVLDEYAHGTADDHYIRKEIISNAIERAKNKSGISSFRSITYVGDGVWDHRSAKALGLNFVGVDSRNSGTLRSAGVKKVLADFKSITHLEQLIF